MQVLNDIRIALRLLRRAPTVTAISILSISLSIGAAAVVFAAVKSVLIDPLPYGRVEQLVQLRTEFPAMEGQPKGDWIFWNDIQELIHRSKTLESFGVYGNAIYNLSADKNTAPEALYGLRIDAGLFPALGVSPMIGRNMIGRNIALDETRPGHADEMILSYGLWTRRFHGDPTVVGRDVTVDGHACRIIGVMPPQFNFPMRRSAAHTPSPYVEFWAPFTTPPTSPQGALGAVARLRPGATIKQASQEIDAISTALARDFPATNRDKVLRVSLLRDRLVGPAKNALWLLMGSSLLFMLIGCANVANLLLARGLARQREINVRMALGAARGRIIRQLLTESCVLAAAGGAGAYLVTLAAWKILPAVAPVTIPRLAASQAGVPVFGFALALAMVNGILFGLAPALRLTKITAGLNTRGAADGHRHRLRSSLVVAEVAVTVILTVAGAQLLGSFVKLLAAGPGFDADRVVAAIILPTEQHRGPARSAMLYTRILDAARALPGVESAGTVDALPFSGENHGGWASAGEAGASRRVEAEVNVTGGDYLQAMGVRLREGRWFLPEEETDSSDAAIIDQSTAEKLFPGVSAVSRRICVYCSPELPNNWKRVVGAVSSAQHRTLDESGNGNVYLAASVVRAAPFLVVRTGRPANEMSQAIRRAVASIDPNQPVFVSASMSEFVADSVADRRFILILLGATGLLALGMSAAGVYGVISYAVSRRTQEMGIRIAVGASPGDIFALIFRQGFTAVAIGLGFGAAGAAIALQVLRGTLAGLDTAQPEYFWLAAGVVAATTACACAIPARRVTALDPLAALREE